MKAMNQDAAPIKGSWTHSFEEDEGGVLVYRPTHSFLFPPTRGGRDTLEFGERRHGDRVDPGTRMTGRAPGQAAGPHWG